MDPSCSSTNLFNLGSTRSMRSTGRFPSPGSRDISAAVAVVHGKGRMACIVPSDDPAYAVVGVASPRDNSVCVALVGCFGERLPDDVMRAGLRETMFLALDFPARGARCARTWFVAGDCIFCQATSTPRGRADALTDLSIVGRECDPMVVDFPTATDSAVPAGWPA
jgi:hypothetical protein